MTQIKQLVAALILVILLNASSSSQVSLAVESPSFPLISNLRSANEYFIGREDFLKNMHDFLFNKAESHALIISGSPGCGKTQVITRFAELHKTNYEIIWLFDLSNNIDEQYRDFARKWNKLVNKQVKDDGEQNFLEIYLEATSSDKLKEEIYDRLKQTNLNWLIIFNKAEDSIISLKDLPKHKAEGYGHIILSTKNNVHLENVMYLDKLTREESVELLLKITGETDSNKANLLAATLKDYPLAIAKAGSYIAAHSAINMAEYNQLFMTKRQALWQAEYEFNNKRDDFNSYKNTLFTTLTMAINEVKKESRFAYDLLAITSFLVEQDIPEELLIQYFKLSHSNESLDIDFKNALSSLKKHSLLIRNHNIKKLTSQKKKNKEDKKKQEDKESLFVMHEIVQLVVKELLDEEEKKKYLTQAIITINQLLPTNIYQLTDLLKDSNYLLSHMRSLINKAEELKLYNNEVMRLNLRLLEYTLPGIRNDQEAERQIANIEQLEKKIKKIEDITIVRFAVMKSAYLAWVKADYPASLKEATYAYELINKLSKTNNAEHPREWLMIYNRLSRLYNVMGDNEQAFKYAELGKDIINNTPGLKGYQKDFYKILVKIYLDSGDLNQALKYSELNSGKLEEASTNGNSISTSDISANLIHADILIRLKHYKIAKQKLDLLLKLTEKSLPKTHIYRANIMVFSSYINSMLGINLKQAIQDSLYAQRIYKKLFDEKSYYKNRHIFISHRFLGEIFEKHSNYEKANEQYLIALKILNNIYFQKNRPVTYDLSDLYYKLALTNIKLNNIQEALEYYKVHQKVFGVDHERSIKIAEEFINSEVDLGF